MKKTPGSDQLSFETSDETEILAKLSERVERAVQMIQDLRRERDELRSRVEKAESQISSHQEAQDHFSTVESEVEKFRSERSEIRNRIENILGSLDALEESAPVQDSEE